MKKQLFTLLFVLLYGISHAQIAPVYAAQLQHILDSVCKKNKIKGVTAAVYRPGEGIWTGAYGESHAGVHITTTMNLPIGSNTKTFVSAALLKMQENGQLDLDDTIGTWIKHPNAPGTITIRQMLNHTSGLNDYTQHDNFFAALNSDYSHFWQPEDMLQFIDTPLTKAGTEWNYCNTNYLFAGMIISKVMNKPVEQALRDLILTPQNLSETFFYPQEQPTGVIPHAWSQMSQGQPIQDLQVDFGWENTAFHSMAGAAGAYVSTAEDNAKFWHQLMTGKIINTASLAEMKAMVPIDQVNGYGLGIFKIRMPNRSYIYNHGGTCFGYLAENAYDSLTGISISILSNQDSVGNSLLLSRLVGSLHTATLKMPALGISEHMTGMAVNIYPNPATDKLHVHMQGATEARFELADMTGKIVLQQTISDPATIAVDHISQGLYIGRVVSNGQVLHLQKIQLIK